MLLAQPDLNLVAALWLRSIMAGERRRQGAHGGKGREKRGGGTRRKKGKEGRGRRKEGEREKKGGKKRKGIVAIVDGGDE